MKCFVSDGSDGRKATPRNTLENKVFLVSRLFQFPLEPGFEVVEVGVDHGNDDEGEDG